MHPVSHCWPRVVRRRALGGECARSPPDVQREPASTNCYSPDLDYDETVRALRRSLAESNGNARAFSLRSRGAPVLLSGRSWEELSSIETLLAALVEQAIQRQLKIEPWTTGPWVASLARVARNGLFGGERSVVARILGETRSHPVDGWRAGAPQLETSLWPFFVDRTRYLANTMSLALDERAPYPPRVWNPRRQGFSS